MAERVRFVERKICKYSLCWFAYLEYSESSCEFCNNTRRVEWYTKAKVKQWHWFSRFYVILACEIQSFVGAVVEHAVHDEVAKRIIVDLSKVQLNGLSNRYRDALHARSESRNLGKVLWPMSMAPLQ